MLLIIVQNLPCVSILPLCGDSSHIVPGPNTPPYHMILQRDLKGRMFLAVILDSVYHLQCFLDQIMAK